MRQENLFQSIVTASDGSTVNVDDQFPFYPLDAPGMPLPGPNFVAAAMALGDPEPTYDGKGASKRLTQYGPFLHYLYRRALYDETFELPVDVKGTAIQAPFVPGHIFADPTQGMNGGPAPAPVMVIGKNPGWEEVQERANFVGPTSSVFFEALDQIGLGPAERAEWYVTNLVKWPQLNRQSDSIPQAWVRDCMPLLHEELRLVRPQYILCLGSDASKALLGSQYGVQAMTGRVMELCIPLHDHDAAPRYHVCKVMTALHPAAVFRTTELFGDFLAQLRLFVQLTHGADVGGKERDTKHVVIYTHRHLKQVVDEIIADPNPSRRLIAVDCEWHGEHPWEPGAYLRTIQFSTAEKEAYCVVLRHQGGAPAFQPGIDYAIRELCRLLKRDPEKGYYPRPGGWFFRADLPWLIRAGIDIREEYAPAESPEKCRTEGGWEASLAYHAVFESASYKLEDVAMRLTSCPRWDTALQQWRRQYCYARKLKDAELGGYGMCPDWVLHPYACLHGDSLVQLGDGRWMKIRTLVRQRYAGTVLSLTADGRVVKRRVINWHRHAVGQREWLQIRTATTPSGRWGLLGPAFTPDHELYTQRGKVRVDQIVPGEDCIATEEFLPSPEQLSVILGCLLGDGGFQRKNDKRVGFGFGQRPAVAAYADWKAASLATFAPRLRRRQQSQRYETPYGRVWAHLAEQYPTKPVGEHQHRRAYITERLLNQLGDLGVAVWYQDDGTLVQDKRCNSRSSRIYAVLTAAEAQLLVDWMTREYGSGVTYNRRSRFVQISGEAFGAFHRRIATYVHPAMAYKTVEEVRQPYRVAQATERFYEQVLEVVPRQFPPGRRGHGVRYCLTVEKTNNFLTKVGFVSNCYDVDATRRIAVRCFQPDGLLDRDWYGNDSWTPYWIAHSASLAFLEMEMNGILLDKQRVDELTNQYMFVRDKLLEDFRRQIRWPAFNPRSQPQCIALLFGDEYVNKRDRETGRLVQIRPDGAVSLGLTPIKTTGRRSRLWADVVARGEAGQYSPSTDKETLGILGHEHPLAMRLRDLKFISQILTSVLRTPVKGDTDDMFLTDEDGNRVYDDGLPGSVMSDGRVHTHLFQTKETGRAASARPALQNLSKRREDDYGRILGIIDKDGTPKGDYLDVFGMPLYQHPIRSILRASPGHVLVECDYTGAELAVIAWLSGDPVMIEHVRRNALPEEHPDFFDMHSQTAVRVFQLRCAPTKKGLKDAGYKGMRVAAKNVNFGIPYGRSAEAISRQCREEGVEISVDDTQAIIDYYFQTYQRTAAFLAECRRRSQEERWLANPYRRLRRFIGTRDRGVIGEQERQAQNFPIQSAVADAISVALRNFLRFRKEQPEVTFRLLLQIHDALLFEVPYAHVPAFVRDELDAAGNIVRPSVLRRCMVDEVPLQPCYLDGSPMSSGPYHFAIDTELCINWGEQLPKAVRDQLLEHGVLSC